MEGVIAVFIPIVMFLVFGIIIVTYVYFRSRERQLLIEKGLSAEEIKSFFEEKRDPFRMLKIGIISIFFGLGLGLGMLSGDETTREVWMPMTIFVFTGLGFVVANLLGNKMRNNYDSDIDSK
jgi:ABC-type spermidine/putrescine transport system permease subunit II